MLSKDTSATKVPVTAGVCALFTGQNIGTTFFIDFFFKQVHVSPHGYTLAKRSGQSSACPGTAVGRGPTGTAPWPLSAVRGVCECPFALRLCTGCRMGRPPWPWGPRVSESKWDPREPAMALLTCRGGQCLLGSQTQWPWLDPASSESRLTLEHPRLSRAGEALAGLCSQVLGRTGWLGVLAPAPLDPTRGRLQPQVTAALPLDAYSHLKSCPTVS